MDRKEGGRGPNIIKDMSCDRGHVSLILALNSSKRDIEYLIPSHLLS